MQWDAFAAIVALCTIFLTITPSTANLMTKLYHWGLRTIFPTNNECEVFKWHDIPEGPLHECKPFQNYCNRTYDGSVHASSWGQEPTKGPPHSPVKCWESILSMVFARGWDAQSRKRERIKKPLSLPPQVSFIRVDVEIIHAIRLFTPLRSLKFRVVGDILTAHLDPTCVKHYPDLTKRDVEHISRGFLPWYRESILTVGGIHLPTPLQELADVNRGGWLVALGLSQLNPIESYVVAPGMYVDEHFFGMANIQGEISVYKRAVSRIEHAIGNLNTAYPGDKSVHQARAIFAERYRGTWPPSGLWYTITRSGLFEDWTESAQHPHLFYDIFLERPWAVSLSKEHCLLAIGIFNRLNPLTHEEVALVRPVLRQVVQAAIYGISVVHRYQGLQLIPLPELENHKYVFLSEC